MQKNYRKIENKIIDLITDNIDILFVGLLLIISIIVRFKLLDYESMDFELYLKNWFMDLKQSGGLRGVGTYTGDYNTPYVFIMSLLTYIPLKPLYSIKIVSIIFDYIIAIISAVFVYRFTSDKKDKKQFAIITLVIMFFLPTVLVNSAFWGQCDVIYASFVVLSLYFMLKDKYTLSFIMFGVAFSFKLQAIFILPAYLIIYLKEKKFSIVEFLLLPVVYIVLSIPSLIFGKTLKDIFLVYVNQTGTYKTSLSYNFPNFYSLINFDPKYFGLFAIAICLLLFAILAYLIIKSNKKLSIKTKFLLVIISVLVAACFLPYMHERYMIVADILSVIYAFIYREKVKNAIFIELFSLNAYFSFLSGVAYVPSWIWGVLILYIIYDYVKDFFKNLDKK